MEALRLGRPRSLARVIIHSTTGTEEFLCEEIQADETGYTLYGVVASKSMPEHARLVPFHAVRAIQVHYLEDTE